MRERRVVGTTLTPTACVGGEMASPNRTCSIPGCERSGKIVRGWCGMHYKRWRVHGSPHVVNDGQRCGHCGRIVSQTEPHSCPPKHDPVKMFWARVNKNGPIPETQPALGPCWIWTGYLTHYGYGRVWVGSRYVHAHRFSYELLVKGITEGLFPDHICRNRACVNPEHIEPVTHKINTLRGIGPPAINGRKTQCNRGHPFDLENTYYTSDGYRSCRACHRQNEARRRKALR